MSDRRLQVFATVARLLSFTRAAEVLHMTQPAVTFQVRQLEEQLDTRLFDRTHNRVTLTDTGRLVFRYAERIFETYAEMEAALRELKGAVGGALVLGASTTVAEYLLPTLLGAFLRSHPEVGISLRVGNTEAVVAMVEESEIDLGVVEATVGNRNLIVHPCLIDRLRLIVPPDHRLAQRDKVTLKDFVDEPFVCREEGSGTREVIMDYLTRQGCSRARLNLCMELGSPEAIKGAVAAGMGISMLSESVIAKEVVLGQLVAIPLEPTLERPISLVHARQKFRVPTLEVLLRFMREYCTHGDRPDPSPATPAE
ncbi:LysR family transcriptional regulator [Thioalkalivibrio paradoxus]|uniref:LysR family transcriptional regulator n=1 Tax=Thioalkalivibrio paradoxus ARh 1 TaxID=713585 RepID=W0DG86_9GAMM|nr:LysR family transcriptional regulator [Thioalkalivibrio paradoxus]AHE97371.1 LysR family transcriptional regulator [Thioalkalivibrio paradoxus ARh 1]